MSQNNGWISVPCAFCRGRGVDPYDLLSSLSRCEVCKGQRMVHIPQAHEQCPFCKGSGSYKTYSCMVCRGKGAVAELVGPTEVCPQCDGLAFEASSGLPCLECKGLGRVLVSPKKEGVSS